MTLNTNKKYFYPLLENGLSRRDISEGQKVLKTSFITMGKHTSKFEKIFAKKFKSKYAVMVNSGSSAKLYNLNKKNIKFEGAQFVEDLGFVIGLHTKKTKTKTIKKLVNSLFSIDKI